MPLAVIVGLVFFILFITTIIWAVQPSTDSFTK